MGDEQRERNWVERKKKAKQSPHTRERRVRDQRRRWRIWSVAGWQLFGAQSKPALQLDGGMSRRLPLPLFFGSDDSTGVEG
jgi:hypothetical protein